MNAVRASDLRRFLKLERPSFEHGHEAVDLCEENVAGFSEQQRIRGIDNVAAGEAVMNEARCRADVFSEIRRKRDHVVIGRFLDLIDPLDCKGCLSP